MPIDYRDLLLRYLIHVRWEEGVDFTERLGPHAQSREAVVFTEGEIAEMMRLAEAGEAMHQRSIFAVQPGDSTREQPQRLFVGT